MFFISTDKETAMARTLAQIKKQIDQLEREAEQVREKEVADVIERIKAAIDFYGLMAKDLFGPARKTAGKGSKKAASKKNVKRTTLPKYRDPVTGKTWTGHGKRPGWFVQAIERGVKPEEMAV